MNLFKRFQKPIILDCYTCDSSAFNTSKIQPATKFLPDWWKQIPKYNSEPGSLAIYPTMKGCSGFTDLFKTGFILPLWSDVAIEVGAIGTEYYRYQFSDKVSSAVSHAPDQRGSAYPVTNYLHLKLISPWLLSCDEPINFMFTDPVWTRDDPTQFTTLPGILEFVYQKGTNINLLFKRPPETIVQTLHFGQPLAQLVPLTERRVELKHHLISDAEYRSLKNIGTNVTFLGKYRANKQSIKANGCPFHFKAEK